MVKAVIFDVDGTLIDSVSQHAKAWQDAFRDFGHDFPLEDIRRQIGKGGDHLLPVFLSEAEIEERGEALEAHRAEILKTRYLPTIEGLPGVRDLVRRLRADGRRLALASSAKADELQTYKTIAGIADLIGTETSSDDAEASKPDPDIFEAALERLDGIAPQDAIVIGDTPYDAEAARKAGLRTIGLLSGGWTADELLRAGCIATYRDPADLLAAYDTSPLHPTKP
ncbi:HAD family hydrolase [Methylobacterium gossipiicola]|uniref:Haloacid dehalogenase superfamily, subfamily IA, variant 3 with third motif having DD or ED/haloacid dehalogenase superfamily, subfamily IA, variant 1 with third motif having Dx(3-4)D or Dx(3-4)E n=1 Tax=Methylobacterium gossipiicola TaxID=582675 RepID=A0A1I2QNR2_9HYPH|nr:HAD family hydrolase [Methylobacterium gossipiicola]SFG30235.1 haloacid dehalogenase superfamily, subfamily IA, variant 3 with third motif having DD or ED/haloacid dehalogenase superfamily, subfamily IA, variant 1 with third motif having Dx(3-4)D or Dx(3-4)E [Methylobacterium gossipiicola]